MAQELFRIKGIHFEEYSQRQIHAYRLKIESYKRCFLRLLNIETLEYSYRIFDIPNYPYLRNVREDELLLHQKDDAQEYWVPFMVTPESECGIMILTHWREKKHLDFCHEISQLIIKKKSYEERIERISLDVETHYDYNNNSVTEEYYYVSTNQYQHERGTIEKKPRYAFLQEGDLLEDL